MNKLLELARRLRFLLHRAEYERDLEEEMGHHLTLLEEDGVRGGQARRQFGNLTSLREESRSMWSFAFLDQFAQDLRYAARSMAAQPLFTATAVLSLALGIGANTAIYSFMDAILLRALPVYHPEQLAVLEWHAARRPAVVKNLNGTMRRYASTGILSPNFPYSGYRMLGEEKQVFSTLFAYTYARPFNVITGGEAETLTGGSVSGNYFSGLSVPPAAGRLIDEGDDRAGAAPTVALAYSYWQRRFGGNPAAIGQTLRINEAPFTIVGVASPGFFGVDPQSSPSFFLPIHCIPVVAPNPAAEAPRFNNDHFYWIEMMGRLRPGVTMEQAQSVVRARFRAFAAGTAASAKDTAVLPDVTLEAGGSGLDSLRNEYSKPLYVLMTMVGLILAIACANLANLLLARAAARRREVAVRLSLGASRGRIVRQMLTESVLLAVTGGALGLGVAFAGIRFITWLLANGQEHFTLRAALDWPVLGFTFALSVAAGILFGLAPALQATKVDVTPALKESRTQGAGARGRRFVPRLGHALLVAQIAVSLLLVIGASLFVRTLVNLHAIDVGFNRENLLLVNLNGRQGGYRDAPLARFYAGLLEKFRAIPGVRAASASNFPLVARYINDDDVFIPGRTHQPTDPDVDSLSVDPDFLNTMQIPMLLGRSLEPGDLASPDVAVVNQKFAAAFFGGENPVGRQFSLGKPDGPLIEIVGVAKTAHYNSLQETPPPVVYLPYTHDLGSLAQLFFEIRTAGPPLSAAAAVRRIVHEASASVSIGTITTQRQRIDQTISQEHTFAELGSCFAALALLIACVGLYGAMAYTVARRTGEIGIRMALGAQRPGIVWMVLRQVLAVAAAGLAVGYGAARFTTRFLEAFLYRLKPDDPLAVAGAIAILLVAALAAGFLPAWRASRIDPAAALRNE